MTSIPSLTTSIKQFSKITSDISDLFGEVTESSEINPFHFSWTAESLTQEFSLSKSLFISVKDREKEKLAGFIFWRENLDFIEIISLATSPVFKRKGVQQAVLNEVFKIAESNALKILLEVHIENKAAIELYKKNNFKIIHTRRSYYPDGSDALVMEKVF